MWIILAVSLTVAVIVRIAGVPFSADQLSSHPTIPTWQLLDSGLLQHHLLSSIYDLEMQPPLYNLGIGLLLDLPHQVQHPVAEFAQFLFYAVTGVATFGALTELGSPRRVALGVTLGLVVLDPAQFLFSVTTFYATPTAALATCLAYAIIRLLKKPSRSRALFCGIIASALALLNTSVQPLSVFVLFALILLMTPGARRVVIKGAAIPLVLLLLWTAHTIIDFGTPATSTWFGMNLAHTTIDAASPHEIQLLIRSHRLSKMARIPPFSPLSDYGHLPLTHGKSALTQVTKGDGSPNFNNRNYATISQRYLQDDLRYISAKPTQYLAHVGRGVEIWLVPSDQYFTLSPGLSWYRNAYDTFVQWQPRNDSNAAYLAVYSHAYPTALQMSYLQVVIDVLVLVGTPVLVITWWKRRRPLAHAVTLLGLLFLQSFVIMNLTDIAENNRFRFEAGTTPIILAVTVVLAALGRLTPDEPATLRDNGSSAPVVESGDSSVFGADGLPTTIV